ncbi:uncharacterized protein PFL1_00781 [Pseudozyma flocculosa PF-1]|uniref:Alpha/beta hydrolase fold-3 domain-containing protein n=1 Tax=Pseudozyma flocculosa TaxID=84751 RepID=A0A5C3F364_9BASI|nr:uncharacterized protein PFL1_00781 [Pseudozyma flocculosa PF-1]EPQ31446.1 hypothetical protein PFL1_00781 [Pseudozyma flocculosa PF-1]SPO38772.1 uncharacterized protein PSFLO_04251 [Pseudozyma flocculosa]
MSAAATTAAVAAPPQRHRVDPRVEAAVRAAKPFQPRYLVPLLRILVFHLYFVPTSLLAIPLIALRCIVPALRPNPRWSFLTALSILNVRRAMRSMIRFGFQPIQPREGGWRDTRGSIAALLNVLNYSGPGGSVTHPKLAADAAKKVARGVDKVWFDPPPLDALTDVLSVRTQGAGRGLAVQSTHYAGPPLLDPAFAKTRSRAFWFMHRPGVLPPSAQAASKSATTTTTKTPPRERPVILYFHGGAGVTFSAADLFMGQCLASNLAKSSGADVFSVDYLLAPHGPFPVPLMQGVAAYIYLHRTLGYRTDQIYIGGDSYGAWLTLCLERYLRTYAHLVLDDPESHASGAESPSFVAGLVLLSPHIAHDGDHFASRQKYVATDIIDLSYGEWGADAQRITPRHRATNPLPLSDPWYTHSNKPSDELARLPPVYIANGDNEVLRDEGIYFAQLLRQAKGGLAESDPEVVLESEPDMPHDYFTLDTERARARKVYGRIGKWIRGITEGNGSGYRL